MKKTENLKWLITMKRLPFDSGPKYERRYRHLFALYVQLNREGKKKKKGVKDVTLGTDGEPGAALSNIDLQEAAGAVHRHRSAITL